MLRLQWNALRPGDHVFMHDDTVDGSPLIEGVVSAVDWHGTGSDVAIRVPGHERPLRPKRLAVHLVRFEPRETCWRCKNLASSKAA